MGRASALLAATAAHNGWLYYQGGDQTFFYTIAWVVSHGHLPVTGIGYAWSLVEAPVAAVAGPSFLTALPGIVAIQVVLLLPLGLVAFYGTAKRLLGPAMARLGGDRMGGGPLRGDPALRPPLPRTLGRSDAAPAARAQRHGRLHLDGPACCAPPTCSSGTSTRAAGRQRARRPRRRLRARAQAVDRLSSSPAGRGLLLARRFRGLVVFGVALVPAVLTLARVETARARHLPIFSLVRIGPARGRGSDRLDQSSQRHPQVRQPRLESPGPEPRRNPRILLEQPARRVARRSPGVLAVAPAVATEAALLGDWLAAYVVVKGTVAPRGRRGVVLAAPGAGMARLSAAARDRRCSSPRSAATSAGGASARPAGVAPDVRSGGRRRSASSRSSSSTALPRDSVNRAFSDDARHPLSAVDPSIQRRRARRTATRSRSRGGARTARRRDPRISILPGRRPARRATATAATTAPVPRSRST